jgi:beta-glucosidase
LPGFISKKEKPKQLSFLITADKLQYYGPHMKRIVEPGEFEVQVGRNSADYLKERFEVIKQ